MAQNEDGLYGVSDIVQLAMDVEGKGTRVKTLIEKGRHYDLGLVRQKVRRDLKDAGAPLTSRGYVISRDQAEGYVLKNYSYLAGRLGLENPDRFENLFETREREEEHPSDRLRTKADEEWTERQRELTKEYLQAHPDKETPPWDRAGKGRARFRDAEDREWHEKYMAEWNAIEDLFELGHSPELLANSVPLEDGVFCRFALSWLLRWAYPEVDLQKLAEDNGQLQRLAHELSREDISLDELVHAHKLEEYKEVKERLDAAIEGRDLDPYLSKPAGRMKRR